MLIQWVSTLSVIVLSCWFTSCCLTKDWACLQFLITQFNLCYLLKKSPLKSIQVWDSQSPDCWEVGCSTLSFLPDREGCVLLTASWALNSLPSTLLNLHIAGRTLLWLMLHLPCPLPDWVSGLVRSIKSRKWWAASTETLWEHTISLSGRREKMELPTSHKLFPGSHVGDPDLDDRVSTL